jgi:hypothetical protein
MASGGGRREGGSEVCGTQASGLRVIGEGGHVLSMGAKEIGRACGRR